LRDEPRSSSSRFFGDDVELQVTDSTRRDENANANDVVANTASSDLEAVALGGRTPWWAKTFFDDAFSFSGKLTPHEALDRLVAARAVDRESVSVGECPRRVPGPRHRPPADTPVFSSPLVHVVAPGGVSNVSSSTPDAKTVSRETTEPCAFAFAFAFAARRRRRDDGNFDARRNRFRIRCPVRNERRGRLESYVSAGREAGDERRDHRSGHRDLGADVPALVF
jgi:hypothetical protein